jgi:hypothetical protein
LVIGLVFSPVGALLRVFPFCLDWDDYVNSLLDVPVSFVFRNHVQLAKVFLLDGEEVTLIELGAILLLLELPH